MKGACVRLEYLMESVRQLHLRDGFVRTHETDTQVFLERPPRDSRAITWLPR